MRSPSRRRRDRDVIPNRGRYRGMTLRTRDDSLRFAFVWRRRASNSAALAVILACVSTLAAPAVPTPVSAAPPGEDTVVAFIARGVGNGHGRGMSQWGAYGRAIAGQSWQQILDAYYGGTESGTLTGAEAASIRVRLTPWDGAGTFGVVSPGATGACSGAQVPASSAVHRSMYAVEVAPNVFDVYVATDRVGCVGAIVVPETVLTLGMPRSSAVEQMQLVLRHFGHDPLGIDGEFGPLTAEALASFQRAVGLPVDGNRWDSDDWTAASRLLAAEARPSWQLAGDDVRGPIRFTAAIDQSTSRPGDVLGACGAGGSVRHYRGALEVFHTSDGNRVVNEVSVENYLRGVVPKEVSASWGDAAGGAGMNALRAQAVAARSYGVSEQRFYFTDASQGVRYATTCDTTSCQVYAGAATRSSVTASAQSVEHPNTDAAIAATAGVVRRWPATGRVVRTEFSASNGPRTAGGEFPAVDDPLDDQPENPNHRWTRIIDADAVVAEYGLATASTVATRPSTSQADAGFEGIWANEVTFGPGAGTVSAWNFRGAFGLPSPGFQLIPVRRDLSAAGSFAFIGDSVGRSVTQLNGLPFPVLTEGVFGPVRYDSLDSRRTQGGSIPDGVTAAGQVAFGTDVVVVELGYNDDPTRMPGRIDAVMEALRARDVGRVVWVTVSERRESIDFAATNQAIRGAESRWPELEVIDWHAASSGASADRWYSDDVHLTATGRAEFALFLRDEIIDVVGGDDVPALPLVPKVPLRVPVTGVAGVPSDASGVALNVTAVGASRAGWLRVWPCESRQPSTSSVNFEAGSVSPNAVVVPVDGSGEVCVVSSQSVDVVVDVAGWFESGVRSGSGELRLVDTREGAGGVRLEPKVSLRVPVTDAVSYTHLTLPTTPYV